MWQGNLNRIKLGKGLVPHLSTFVIIGGRTGAFLATSTVWSHTSTRSPLKDRELLKQLKQNGENVQDVEN